MIEMKRTHWMSSMRSAAVTAQLVLAIGLSACTTRHEVTATADPADAPAQPGRPGPVGDNGRPPAPVAVTAPTVLSVFVRENGSVGDIRLQSSSGDPQRDKAALSVVRGWQFVPKVVDGTPVADWVEVPFSW